MKLSRILLYCFFISINFEVYDPLDTDGIFSISKLFAIIFFGSILNRLNLFLRLGDFKKYLFPIGFFLFYLVFISLLHLDYNNKEFFQSTVFLNTLLFLILLNYEEMEPRILHKALLAFAFGSFSLSILFQFGIGVTYSAESGDGRVSLFGDNENLVGLRMAISSIIFWVTAFHNNLNFGKWRFLLIIPIIFMVILMAETGSRTAFLAFISSFAIGLILRKNSSLTYKLSILFSGLIIGFLLFKFFSQSLLWERIIESKQSGDLNGRDDIWNVITILILENPIFGVGLSGYNSFSIMHLSKIESPHNVILEILCYTGLFGLIIYLIFLFRVFRQSFLIYIYNGQTLQILLLIPFLFSFLSGQTLNVKICWVILAFASRGLKNYINKQPGSLLNENTLHN